MNSHRKPWLAGLLTFITIGLGHVYSGKARKGIVLFLLGQLFFGCILAFLLAYSPVGLILGVVVCLLYFFYCIINAYVTANESGYSYTLKRYNRWYVYLCFWFFCSVVIGSVMNMAVKTNIAQSFHIPSGAMLGTLQIGDYIICNKFIYKTTEPKRGDIIIFPYPKDPSVSYIKRVIGLPGESVEIKNKDVLINGKLLDEPYVIHTTETILSPGASPRDNFGPVEIPQNELFLMGDNRDNSFDSRFWGFVNVAEIKGKVIYVYWSWNLQDSNVRWERLGKRIK
jgi:signal peptidase I